MSNQVTTSHPTLRRGSEGEVVENLQIILNGSGASSLTVDGEFGLETEKVVKLFQSSNGLEADGIVGSQTWSALDAVVQN